jgi:SAM-dependent methyltransferase
MRPSEHEAMYAVEERHFWFLGTRRVIVAALERALGPALAGARLLDLGCGTGFTLSQLPRGVRAVGLDYSSTALALATRRATGAGLVRGSAYHLPFADGSFDAALSLDVLEHLQDDRGAAREIARVLRPGGVAVVTVPAFRALWSAHDEALDHLRRYRLHEIEDVLREAGLGIDHATYYNFFLFPMVAAARALQRLGLSPAKVGTDLRVPIAPLNAVLREVLGSEGHIAPRMKLPIGVSCLVIARRPA